LVYLGFRILLSKIWLAPINKQYLLLIKITVYQNKNMNH